MSAGQREGAQLSSTPKVVKGTTTEKEPKRPRTENGTPARNGRPSCIVVGRGRLRKSATAINERPEIIERRETTIGSTIRWIRLKVEGVERHTETESVFGEAPVPSAWSAEKRGLTLLRTTTQEYLGHEEESRKVTVVLCGTWAECEVQNGAVVHVVDYETFREDCLVVSEGGSALLIVSPDVLLTGTTVGNSFSCTRKTVLEYRYGDSALAPTPEDAKMTRSAVFGVIVHEALERCLTERNMTQERFLEALTAGVLDNMMALALAGENKEGALKTLSPLVEPVCRWFEQHASCLESTSRAETTRKEHHLVSMENGGAPVAVDIEDILGTEESIWSPLYGLKGKLDVVTRTRFGTDGPGIVSTLEIKTGREHSSHRAQVALYLLLLHDRYGVPYRNINGLVLYVPFNRSPTACAKSVGVPLLFHELREMIKQRNRLAFYLDNQNPDAVLRLPSFAFDKSSCHFCGLKRLCSSTSKIWEQDTPIPESVGDVTATPKELDFIAKYEKALVAEGSLTTGSQQTIWLTPEQIRVEEGRCLPHLKLLQSTLQNGKWMTTFTRNTSSQERGKCFFSQGDYVVLSSHDGFLAVEAGLLQEINDETVTIATDRPIPNDSQMKLWRGTFSRDFKNTAQSGHEETRLWKLDRVELPSTFAFLKVCS